MSESGEWKGLAVKAAAGFFALALAGFAVYKISSTFETTSKKGKGSAHKGKGETTPKEATTPDQIEMLMKIKKCSRNEAIKALRLNND